MALDINAHDYSHSLWQGKLIRLRAIEPGDWETYFAWNFDDGQTRVVSWRGL